MKLWGFRPRGTGRVHQEYAPPSPAEVTEMRLIELQARVQDAERLIRSRLADPPADRVAALDLLLEVLVALGAAPAAEPDPPIPGASS